MGLLFYLAHRSDHTLSNRLVSYVCGPSAYVQLKQELRHWLPVPLVLRGCLPSVLWCFIVISLFGGWKIRIGGCRMLPLAWLSPVINACWEIIQCIGWTDGHADSLDVVAGLVGWTIAHVIFFHSPKPAEEISALWNWRMGIAMTGFATMGFADVWK
jgi:hypothetical protein